jgi:TRAP-type C4-dicarboxylate transport system substrate-binding protein
MNDQRTPALRAEWCKGLLVSIFCATLFMPANASRAADVKERQFKLAFLPVQEHAIGLGAQRFADLVKQKSGGKMNVKLFPGGALGGDLPVLSALQGGTIEMSILVRTHERVGRHRYPGQRGRFRRVCESRNG